MKCSKCGSEIPEGSTFCRECGEKLENPVPVENKTKKDCPRVWPKILITVIITVIVTILALYAFSCYTDSVLTVYEDNYFVRQA